MKWYINKEMLQDILKRNTKDLTKQNSIKVEALLKDESNLIQNHLVLLDENEKLKKAIEILKRKTVNLDILKLCDNVKDYNDFQLSMLSQQEYELLKEVINNE